MDDDDYWNTSETKAKAFSFDDDVLSPQEILAIGQKRSSGQTEDSVFATTIPNAKRNLVSINSLVSPKVLDLIVLAQSGRDPNNMKAMDNDSTAVTLKRLVLGRTCSLHVHRSLKSKTELLDGAIALGDGNAILAVVLFLMQTLNKKLVHELISSRPIALNHYMSHLKREGKITDLTDLLTMLGRSPEAAIHQFEHTVKSQGNSIESLLRKLNNILSNHFNQPGVDAHANKMLVDYIKLLEWQKCSNKAELHNQSPLACLAHCCQWHWHEGAGNMMSPLTLCQRQQIPPLQYDWVVLNVHANSSKWDIVESLFTKKDWLGRTTLSSHIPIETLLSRLNDLNASKKMMATCLNKIQSNDDRLRLAQKYKIHTVVIESLVKQKDRSALTNYKMALSPQSEEYILADNTLRDPSVKWKN
ncbi:uncharacterized protein LOC119837941 [Zerene cesonia]|uniref:uncharacterized protein LOC119837941 n=1 Tax=Zerene cesonia TaxID=33412 RepID=UPI0018E50A8B|nr:uncharacterized protein LOC119837941 [Zerene cesonia]